MTRWRTVAALAGWTLACGGSPPPPSVRQASARSEAWRPAPVGPRVAVVQEGHEGAVRALAWSPRGDVLASGAEDGVVRLWDASLRLRASVELGPSVQSVSSIAWSADASTIAVRFRPTMQSDVVRTLSLADGTRAETDRVLSVEEVRATPQALSGDGRLLATPEGRDVQVTNVATAARRARYRGLRAPADAVAWGPEALLACVSGEEVHLWDAAADLQVAVRIGPGPLAAIAWSPDGRWIAARARDGKVRILPVRDGDPTTLEGSFDSIAWSPGSLLAAGRPSGEVVLIDGPPFAPRVASLAAIGDRPAQAVWSPDGARIAVLRRRGGLWIVDARTFSARPLDPGGEARAIAWTADGVATLGSHLAVLDPGTGALLETRTFEDPSQDGYAFVGCDDTLGILDGELLAASGVITELGGATEFAAAPSRDGLRMASVNEAGEVSVWDAAGAGRRPIGVDSSRPRCLSWSPDGRRLAAAGRDGTVHVWNPSTGVVESTLASGPRRPQRAGWSSDGARFVATNSSGQTRVWSIADGSAILDVAEGPDDVALDPSGAFLLRTGAGLELVRVADGRVLTVRFTAPDAFLATTDTAAFVLGGAPIERLGIRGGMALDADVRSADHPPGGLERPTLLADFFAGRPLGPDRDPP